MVEVITVTSYSISVLDLDVLVFKQEFRMERRVGALFHYIILYLASYHMFEVFD